MTLHKSRQEVSPSPHHHEQVAVQHLAEVLPDRAPFHLFALKDFVAPSGRRYEIDAIVLGPNALYLIEIKSHPAHVSGDHVDWTLQWKDGRGRTVMENPVSLANLKAKVLGSQLEGSVPKAEKAWAELQKDPTMRSGGPEIEAWLKSARTPR